MRFSYSRLKGFETCPYAWYLQYLLLDDSGHPIYDMEDNFYGEFGSVCHNLLEKVLLKQISPKEASDLFFDQASELRGVSDQTKEKYLEFGYDYFLYLDLGWLKDYEVLGVEKKCQFEIEGIPFIAFIDLLIQDKETKKIVVVDHKSAEYPLNKNGTVKKSRAETYLGYKRQLYIYSKAVYDEFGEYPSSLWWNFFRGGGWTGIPFNKDEFNETIQWVKDTYEKIKMEEVFDFKEDYFYCHNICSFRQSCEYL